MTYLTIPNHDPDYTVAYILLFLAIGCIIITYKLWKWKGVKKNVKNNI